MAKKFILITGASGGIGQAIARNLAKEGYSLYLHYYKNEQSIQDLLKEFSKEEYAGEYIPIQADLRTENDCVRLCQEIYQIDGIIHNSGISTTKLLTNMLEEEIHQQISIHVTAPILITKGLLPKMIQKKSGNIIFISSIWGQTGASCETVYSAVKGAQISFAKALSKEVAPSNIRVNAIAPGAIATKMMDEFEQSEISEIENEIPLGKLGTAQDVAHAVEYLLSDKSSYITGQVLGVNGGWYI